MYGVLYPLSHIPDHHKMVLIFFLLHCEEPIETLESKNKKSRGLPPHPTILTSFSKLILILGRRAPTQRQSVYALLQHRSFHLDQMIFSDLISLMLSFKIL